MQHLGSSHLGLGRKHTALMANASCVAQSPEMGHVHTRVSSVLARAHGMLALPPVALAWHGLRFSGQVSRSLRTCYFEHATSREDFLWSTLLAAAEG